MKSGENILTKEELSLLNHMTESLEESVLKLKEYYGKKDYERFNTTKKFILNISKKISEMIK
tara:strand:- start:990 stop:1175 length:186 start_codon:yes stop_codon:yes gene_type:complete